jgi:N-acetylmuramoyl-L-alanine amidase
LNRLPHRWIGKLSGATALLLAVSLALPLLAFAKSYIFQAAYDKSTGTVTASVYTDETVTSHVYLDIMDDNTSVIGSMYLGAPTGSYTVGDAVYERYDFTYTVTSNVYDTLKLSSWYTDPDTTDTVTSAVYAVGTPQSPGTGGGGGYIPPYTPPVQPSDGAIGADKYGKLSETALADELKKDGTVTIELAGTFVLLPATALIDAPAGSILVVEKDGVTLELPILVMNFEALAAQTDTAKENLIIRVDIEALAGEELVNVEEAANAMQATLRAPAVEFMLTAIGEEERSAVINDFNGTYVSRTLPVDAATSSSLTGVMYAQDEFTFVPTEFVYDDNGVVTAAVLKRPGNSVYTVLERTKTFLDIRSHWAQDEIEEMAGKLIIEGVTAQQFEPNRSITRAEFATLLVRALALNAKAQGSASFNDVKARDWFAAAVHTASSAGLINGYPDGSFQPNETITRAEMSAMIVRAIAYVKGASPLEAISPDQIRDALAGYDDREGLGWSRTYLAIAVKEGIIEGMTETSLAPNGRATRAQAAVMLNRWLSGIGFISS